MKVSYKECSLRPYPGTIKVFRDLSHLRAYYENKTGKKYEWEDEIQGGRYLRIDGKNASGNVWLVYGRKPHVIAHELAHILLQLWNEIGAHPADGNGEPFCYMLSQLMLEAR